VPPFNIDVRSLFLFLPGAVAACSCSRRHSTPCFHVPLRLLLQALATFGSDVAIAFSGAEDVALVEYAHLTGRPFRVFRCVGGLLEAASCVLSWQRQACKTACCVPLVLAVCGCVAQRTAPHQPVPWFPACMPSSLPPSVPVILCAQPGHRPLEPGDVPPV
jgi:hypothetical protein